MLFAAGYGASGKQANAAVSEPVEEIVEDADEYVMDEAGDKLQEVEDSLSDACAKVEETLPGAAEEIIEDSASDASASDETASDNTASDIEEYDAAYAYANVKFDGDKLLVVPNGTVSDSTVLYNDKMLGGLCDYIDSEVLEDGRTINREFLYDLISVEVIDPQLYPDYDSFSRVMYMCLTMANEFNSIDVRVKDLVLDPNENTKQVFEVTAEGKDTS